MATASPVRQEDDFPKGKRPTKPKGYVPKKGSANYAFLICMAKGHKLGKEHFMKAELMQAAEDSGLAEKSVFGNPEAAKESHISYDGWSNMKTLTNREPALVKRWGNPVKVALTSEGEALANRLLDTAVKEGQTEQAKTAEADATVEIEEEEDEEVREEEEDDDYKPDDAAKEGEAADAELDAVEDADVDEEVDAGEVDDKVDAVADSQAAAAEPLVVVGEEGGKTEEAEEKDEKKSASEKRPSKRAKKAKAVDEDYVELSDEDADEEQPASKGKGKKDAPAKRTRAASAKKSRKPIASTDSDESEG